MHPNLYYNIDDLLKTFDYSNLTKEQIITHIYTTLLQVNFPVSKKDVANYISGLMNSLDLPETRSNSPDNIEDSILEWLDSTPAIAPNNWQQGSVLYQDYSNYLKSLNIQPPRHADFATAIYELGWNKRMYQGRSQYRKPE